MMAVFVSSVVRLTYRASDVEDAHRSVYARFDRLAVGMGAVFERGKGLFENGVGRDEPEHNGAVGLHQFALDPADSMASHERLAASGGHAQADVR